MWGNDLEQLAAQVPHFALRIMVFVASLDFHFIISPLRQLFFLFEDIHKLGVVAVHLIEVELAQIKKGKATRHHKGQRAAYFPKLLIRA